MSARLRTASSYLQSSWEPLGNTEEIALKQAEVSIKETVDEINLFFEKDWADYKKAVEEADISLFKSYEPLQLKE